MKKVVKKTYVVEEVMDLLLLNEIPGIVATFLQHLILTS